MGEGPIRTINVSFTGVRGFSRTQSRIWHIVHSTGFFGPQTVRALPLVSWNMSIFAQLYSFCLLEMHFGAAGELIVVLHFFIFVTICMQCCRQYFSDKIPLAKTYPKSLYHV